MSAFQLLLNPVKQTDDAEEGLNYIADLLVRYRLVEEAYSEEIKKNTKGYFCLMINLKFFILQFPSLSNLAPEKLLQII